MDRSIQSNEVHYVFKGVGVRSVRNVAPLRSLVPDF